MGSTGVRQGIEFIMRRNRKIDDILFLGLCGVLQKDTKLYNIILPSATAICLEEFRDNKSFKLAKMFNTPGVFSGKHFSFESIEAETDTVLHQLEKENVLSIDLEFSFITEIAPDLKGILLSTDNPLHGPHFTKESIKHLKATGIINSVLQILSKEKNNFEK